MISDSASVSPTANVAPSSKVWDLAQIREGASIGEGCVIGRGAYVGPGVVLAANCKIQNFAQLHHPATLGEGVFVGPGAILTNDRVPRAVSPELVPKGAEDWQPVAVQIGKGASIGAGAICVAPVTIGDWALVAAGSVVTRSVPAHSLVMGCPARQVGWVCSCGKRLRGRASPPTPEVERCLHCGRQLVLTGNN